MEKKIRFDEIFYIVIKLKNIITLKILFFIKIYFFINVSLIYFNEHKISN